MLVMDRDASPVLVKVTVCELLVWPTVRLPKERLVADRVTAGAATPMPLREMV